MRHYQMVQFIGCATSTVPALTNRALAGLSKQEALSLQLNQLRLMIEELHTLIQPDEKTLKIFMLPERYFSLAHAMYTIEDVTWIAEKLRILTQEAKYKDFLFVFGTIMAGLARDFDPNAPINSHLLYENFNISLIQKGGHPAPKINDDDPYSLIVYKENIADSDYEFAHGHTTSMGGLPARVLPIEGSRQATPFKIDLVSLEIFNAIYITLMRNRTIYVTIANQTLWCKALNAYGEFATVSLPLSELSPELNNQLTAKMRFHSRRLDYVSYKELMTLVAAKLKIFPMQSPSNPYNEFAFCKDFQYWSSTQSLQTSNPGKSHQGINFLGCSYFTMDFLHFGLEICLDHAEKRLKRAKDMMQSVNKATPPIQIQLIPSCGMHIHPDSVVTEQNGFIFNVDGLRPTNPVVLKRLLPTGLEEIAPECKQGALVIFQKLSLRRGLPLNFSFSDSSSDSDSTDSEFTLEEGL